MTPDQLFPNAKPVAENEGDIDLDFRAFVKHHGLAYIDHVEYPIPLYGEVGTVRYFARRYDDKNTEAQLVLRVFKDASFGVYARIPGFRNEAISALAALGYNKEARTKAA
jgi:hypothetical protein